MGDRRNKGGRPPGSVNRYTGALKELFLQATDEVGDRTEIGPNGELDGNGGALAYLRVTALTERKTFLTVMARLLPITIKTAPPIKKVLTREEALHELRERGLDPRLVDHLCRWPFPEEDVPPADRHRRAHRGDVIGHETGGHRPIRRHVPANYSAAVIRGHVTPNYSAASL